MHEIYFHYILLNEFHNMRIKCRIWQKNVSLENKHVYKLFYI